LLSVEEEELLDESTFEVRLGNVIVFEIHSKLAIQAAGSFDYVVSIITESA